MVDAIKNVFIELNIHSMAFMAGVHNCGFSASWKTTSLQPVAMSKDGRSSYQRHIHSYRASRMPRTFPPTIFPKANWIALLGQSVNSINMAVQPLATVKGEGVEETGGWARRRRCSRRPKPKGQDKREKKTRAEKTSTGASDEEPAGRRAGRRSHQQGG